MIKTNQHKVLAFIGDGEGKTCAAIGHAIRAAGHGKKVVIIQFLKGKDSTGEYLFLKDNKDIDIRLVGEQGFLMPGSDNSKHAAKAKEGVGLARDLIASGKYFLIVLDELLDAQDTGLVGMDDVLSLITGSACPNIVLTGRVMPPELSPHIDLVTRMQKVKHYFDKGVKGIEGLDW